MYELKWSAKEQEFIDLALKNRVPVPEPIANKPELELGLELYYNAFNELDSDRSEGMGLGRIPFTSMMKYTEYFEFSSEQSEMLFFCIKRMDHEYLDYRNKQK